MGRHRIRNEVGRHRTRNEVGRQPTKLFGREVPHFSVLIRYNLSNGNKENEVGRSCSTNLIEQKFRHSFSLKP